ncbi:pantetheinase-like [Tubulanus polymorphus]|uniref:pantetheinase-like n=1 Tax=Tubulanus polymorphus TaxID=672921 RepID=UPI003DA370DE
MSSGEEAMHVIDTNLMVFEEQTKIAKQEGADIILFPENGIRGFGFYMAKPYLDEIPDPNHVSWCPYLDQNLNETAHSEYRLSHMARENSLYLVANVGEAVPCNVHHDPKCPRKGQYQYNTDVVYAPDGCLVAKYRKYHLYFEPEYNTPLLKHVTFQTPFGIFGLLTCFDLLFHEPSISLVKDHGAENIIFPAAFNDGMPLMAAIEFASAWSIRMRVNLLAANIQQPDRQMSGSGVFSPDGPLVYYRKMSSDQGRLLVAKVPAYKPTVPPMARNDATPSLPQLQSSVKFVANLSSDPYHWIMLQSLAATTAICHNSVCCQLSYTIKSRVAGEIYALGAFDGLHTKNGNYYLQVCTVVKCANDKAKSCGSPVENSRTIFTHFDLHGVFNTRYVFPSLNTNGVKFASGEWSFNYEQLEGRILSRPNGIKEPLLSSALYGRFYERDNISSSRSNKKQNPTR